MNSCVRLALGVCVMASAGFVHADTKNTKSGRSDRPWVSLAHQRALDGEKGSVVKDSSSGRKTSVLKTRAGKIAPKLTADKFDYATDDSKTLIASGNAKLVSDEFDLGAEKISYSQKMNAARIMDDARISIDEHRIVTGAADISIDGKTVKSEYARFGSYPMYLEASSVSGNQKEYVLENSTAYFNEPATGSFKAKAKKMTYDEPSNTVKMQDVNFYVGRIPLGHFDELEFEADMEFPWEIRNRIDFNGDYGMALQNTVHYKGFRKKQWVKDNGFTDFSPGFLLDAYWKRSVLVGPAFRYNQVTANNRMKGFIQTGFIHDTGARDILGWNSFRTPIDRDRYFVELRHNQIYEDKLSLTAVVSAWSDEFVTRDFRDDFFYQNQIPDNFVEAMYYGDMWTTSLFTRFAPNNFEFVQQRLPEGRIDIQPVEVFNTGAYLRAFASAAYLHQYNPYPWYYSDSNTNQPIRPASSTRLDSYVGIDRPIELSPWAKITPVAGVRLSSYFDAQNGSSNYTRALAQLGFDAQMDIWGQFDYVSKTMQIDGVRHHISPFVSYRYIPEASQGKNRFHIIDYDTHTTYPPILDLSAMRNIDDMSELNTLRFGVRNVFETRDSVYGSRELARLDIFQDINFKARSPALDYKYWNDDNKFSQDYSDLYVHASLSPARWLRIGTVSRFSLEHSCTPETNNYITLMDSDVFEFSIGTIYLTDSYDGSRSKLEQYYASMEYRISERYQVFGSWHYDAELAEFVRQTYGLRTKIGNTWLVEYYIGYRSGSTREDSASFGVRIVILGL